MGRLDNKVALITGGGSGIGKAIALVFARENADLCIVDINLTTVQGTATEISKIGRKALALQVDVRKMSDLDRMVKETVNYFGTIDILVNSAGIGPILPVLDVTEAVWDEVMDVNLKGLFFATQRVLPIMLKQGKGKIINIASNHGVIGRKNLSAYCAAKAGVINLTRVLALEFALQKINVNAIGPGLTFTPLLANFCPEEIKQQTEEIPMGRGSQPEEQAAAALYLASDESDFVTGQTLFVDGGFISK
jgi:2-deoxy-D-gluconate 3-dehydrogenase